MKSEKWNNITTTVRTNVELPDGQLLLTERQWYAKGYLPISNESGMALWSNQLCQRVSRYLFEDEVRKMTADEKQSFTDEQREIRKQRKEKKEQLSRVPVLENQIDELMENNVWMLKTMVQHILKDHIPLSDERMVVLDIETTGFDASDEPLQISVIDTTGKVLYNSLIKPMFHENWRAAEDVNHISSKDVENAPFLIEEVKKIAEAISNAKAIIGYNVDFDIGILSRFGIPLNQEALIIDVMEKFAPIYGEWSDKYCNYKNQKLTTCAAFFNYDWKFMKAHDSLSDCYTTLYCYEKIKEWEEKTNE